MGDANDKDTGKAEDGKQGGEKDKATLAKAGKAEAAPRAIVALKEDRWQLREHRDPGHWICVPQATLLEDLLEPAFWANIARHLRPAQTVQVHWDDGSQFAELYIRNVGRNWAAVAKMRHLRFAEPTAMSQETKFTVSWNGPVDKYRVQRVSDGAVIKAGFSSELEAGKWLDEYRRKLAA